jgi:glycosyl transferase family 11
LTAKSTISGNSSRGLLAVTLKGQLGNNLFQYALGRALNTEGPVPLYRPLQFDTLLQSALAPGSYRLIGLWEATKLRQPPQKLRPWVKRLSKHPQIPFLTRKWLKAREYRDQGYNPAVFELRGPLLLAGYFQDERYFLDIADRMLADLRPPGPECDLEHDSFRSKVGSGSTVAIVVRAGLDYEKKGWVLGYDWYRRAAELITARVLSPRFAVFSDIPLVAEAVAAALTDLGPAVPITRTDPVAQLHLIAAMDHAVLSASSFAWWGAWLGDVRRDFAADRIVIAPEPWLRSRTTAPLRWTRLSVNTVPA